MKPRYRIANVHHPKPDLRFITLRLTNRAPGNYQTVYVVEQAGRWIVNGFSSLRDGDLPESHPPAI